MYESMFQTTKESLDSESEGGIGYARAMATVYEVVSAEMYRQGINLTEPKPQDLKHIAELLLVISTSGYGAKLALEQHGKVIQ